MWLSVPRMIAAVDIPHFMACLRDAVNCSQVECFVNLLEFRAFIQEQRFSEIDFKYEKMRNETSLCWNEKSGRSCIYASFQRMEFVPHHYLAFSQLSRPWLVETRALGRMHQVHSPIFNNAFIYFGTSTLNL